jgi:hypothetical protein
MALNRAEGSFRRASRAARALGFHPGDATLARRDERQCIVDNQRPGGRGCRDLASEALEAITLRVSIERSAPRFISSDIDSPNLHALVAMTFFCAGVT